MTTKKRAAAEAATHTHNYSLAQNIKQIIATIAIAVGVTIMFILGGVVDGGTEAADRMLPTMILAVLSALGGLAALKMEGALE